MPDYERGPRGELPSVKNMSGFEIKPVYGPEDLDGFEDEDGCPDD